MRRCCCPNTPKSKGERSLDGGECLSLFGTLSLCAILSFTISLLVSALLPAQTVPDRGSKFPEVERFNRRKISSHSLFHLLPLSVYYGLSLFPFLSAYFILLSGLPTSSLLFVPFPPCLPFFLQPPTLSLHSLLVDDFQAIPLILIQGGQDRDAIVQIFHHILDLAVLLGKRYGRCLVLQKVNKTEDITRLLHDDTLMTRAELGTAQHSTFHLSLNRNRKSNLHMC